MKCAICKKEIKDMKKAEFVYYLINNKSGNWIHWKCHKKNKVK